MLRDIQEQAIPAIINGDSDVIIAAATASGKTEAAFFPIISKLLRDKSRSAVFYISPLKALINDQWARLAALCESVDVPVIPWHGDISSSRKHKFLRDSRGILLITPESLEALFVTRGSQMLSITASLGHVVVDELHAFIGAERGKQLQSLLHRLELSAERRLPRIALSATLGDMQLAAEFLRPRNGSSVRLLNSKADHQELLILVRSFLKNGTTSRPGDGSDEQDVTIEIAHSLYKVLRDSNNLIFPNTRSLVERYADLLRNMCERDGLPNQFWAHHGNLSRELREETERALKIGTLPATAVCTSTLELGIDIGSVRSVAQIGPPPSVSSLRQRLGRSGRRAGEAAVLRCFCTEAAITPESGVSDRLRESLLQTTATIRLLLKGWFEPPPPSGVHASTFVQQVMSVVAERGGATAASLWKILVQDGPFERLSRDAFTSVLREMGKKDLLAQDQTGLLLHGGRGERLVNHYEFYASFISEDEFTVEHDGHTLGSLPVSRPLVKDQRIVFGGRRWRVLEADTEAKRISVMPDPGGVPPSFDSAGALVSDVVRAEMHEVLLDKDRIPFLDSASQDLLSEARRYFRDAHLDRVRVLAYGDSTSVFTWRGDRVNDALVILLQRLRLTAWNEGLTVSVRNATVREVRDAFSRIAAQSLSPSGWDIPPDVLRQEKWDWALPHVVLLDSFLSQRVDVAGAQECAIELSQT